MKNLRSLVLFIVVSALALQFPSPVSAAGSARIISLTVNGLGQGQASDLTCTAVPGDGSALLNNMVASGADGAAMLQSFKSALRALRADSSLPGGPVDPSKFDLEFEFSERRATFSGASASLAAALVAYSAMSGKRLRPDIAVTGDLGADGRTRKIGGLYAKVPAAARAGASIMLVPGGNDPQIMALPLEQRLRVAVFGVTNLNQAIQAALSPSEPAARQFNAYLARRNAALAVFVDLYRAYIREGGLADEAASLRASDEQIYRSYFGAHPNAGGQVFAAMQSSLELYPWDESLKSIYEVAKRVRMTLAAGEEAQAAEAQFAAGEFIPAYDRFRQAFLLNPAIVRYKTRAQTAVEEHFKISFRPTIEEARQFYSARKFAEAAAVYRRLAELTKEYKTSFPLLERVSEARARAAAAPADSGLRKTAGFIASREGFFADAAEEYEALLLMEPNSANADLLFRATLEAASQAEKPDYTPVLQAAFECSKALVPRIKSGEAARVYIQLADAAQSRRLFPAAIKALNEAVSLDKSPSVALELAKGHVAWANVLEGVSRKEQFQQAQAVLDSIAETVARYEAAYALREAVDRETGTDTAPPFMQIAARPQIVPGQAVSGTVQLSVFVRDASGVALVNATVDGNPFSRQDTGEIIRSTINMGAWDTRKLANGRHRLEIEAVDVKGNKSRLVVAVDVLNDMERGGEVWGDTRRSFYHLPTCGRAPELMFRGVFASPKLAQIGRFRPCPLCIK